MGRAEAGSTKAISNQLKSKGLTRLRWYCQVCEKACRDANAFKMHCMSESHVRNMVIVGENSKAFIQDYSDQFYKDFIGLLKTAHGEKQVVANHFYQEYIAKKDHIHMNATKWSSLSEFAKYLGKEGICRVEETEKGLMIGWIDDSPEALRRQEALRRKALQDQGDEEVERRLLNEQIKRAQAAGGKREEEEGDRELKREEGEKIKLSFGTKTEPTAIATTGSPQDTKPEDGSAIAEAKDKTEEAPAKPGAKVGGLGGFAMKMGTKAPTTKNVFAQAKKSKSKVSVSEQPKKMSEAERIMKEEMERKRGRESSGFGGPAKKQRFNGS
ncbi:related to mouse KIN17 protein [Cephalotrichum gorgonifer]|uniref:Related to mouse KIN17 protein n=1 Tax=Cephalotrichum gorgonifer TaxID=2041049 RepID=A0AAE8SR62_9PEZI|nr:related to mouse KIN17 protein [Cephalotrichum gorgonifer]